MLGLSFDWTVIAFYTTSVPLDETKICRWCFWVNLWINLRTQFKFWMQILARFVSDFLNFLFYSFSSSFNSWNPHVLWGKSSDFLCKSMDKSSNDADFIKSMDLLDYLRTLNFSKFSNLIIILILKFTSLNLNLVKQISEIKSSDLFIRSVCFSESVSSLLILSCIPSLYLWASNSIIILILNSNQLHQIVLMC